MNVWWLRTATRATPCKTYVAMMYYNFRWLQTATRAAPCKCTTQHLVTGRYISDSNWKLHQR